MSSHSKYLESFMDECIRLGKNSTEQICEEAESRIEAINLKMLAFNTLKENKKIYQNIIKEFGRGKKRQEGNCSISQHFQDYYDMISETLINNDFTIKELAEHLSNDNYEKSNIYKACQEMIYSGKLSINFKNRMLKRPEV